jgi:Flp pilus assembly protein TadG
MTNYIPTAVRFFARLTRLVRKDESGQGLVELALGISLITVLLIGATEFGRLAYASIEIAEAAHTGAEYGSLNHTAAADIANMKLAATQSAPDVKGMTATATRVCTCANGTASTCLATDCSHSRLIEYVQVKTTAAVDPLIYVPGLPKSYSIQSQATMVVVQ